MHMTGCLPYDSMGDPEFVNVVPSGQYMSSYSFYADSTYSEHSLVIVRKKTHGDFKDVWLECAGDLPDWKPIDNAGQYEYRRVDLSRQFRPGDSFGDKQCRTGLQRMRSEGAFSATLWGWGVAASYAYPGGMAYPQARRDAARAGELARPRSSVAEVDDLWLFHLGEPTIRQPSPIVARSGRPISVLSEEASESTRGEPARPAR